MHIGLQLCKIFITFVVEMREGTRKRFPLALKKQVVINTA